MHRLMVPGACFALALALLPTVAAAEQPLFGMMPRWDGGWGVQVEHEHQNLSQGSGHVLHVEGVYTWRKWIRMTYKIPWVLSAESHDQAATKPTIGLGTPILALPLKRYFNEDGRSGSWSLIPQVFLPSSSTLLEHDDDYGGLILGYGHETYRWAVDASTAGHLPRTGESPEGHLMLAFGVKFYGWDSVGNLKLKVHGQARTNGNHALYLGAQVYWRLTDRWHAQASWTGTAMAQGMDDGTWVRSGLAMVF